MWGAFVVICGAFFIMRWWFSGVWVGDFEKRIHHFVSVLAPWRHRGHRSGHSLKETETRRSDWEISNWTHHSGHCLKVAGRRNGNVRHKFSKWYDVFANVMHQIWGRRRRNSKGTCGATIFFIPQSVLGDLLQKGMTIKEISWFGGKERRGTACPDDPHFFPAPITYFDNPMTAFVNCNMELPAIKTNYPMRCLLDCGEVCQRRKSREMYKIIRFCCCPLKFGQFKHFHAKSYQGLQVWRISKLHFVRSLKLV